MAQPTECCTVDRNQISVSSSETTEVETITTTTETAVLLAKETTTLS